MQQAMTMRTTVRWIDAGAQVLIGATAIVAACIALSGAGQGRRGDVPQGRFRMAAAARVATMMARQGPLLFGQHFDVTPERLQRWEQAMRGTLRTPLTSRGTGARTGDSPPDARVAAAR